MGTRHQAADAPSDDTAAAPDAANRTATHITFVSMVHAHPSHVSAAYRIVEGMLMVPDPDAVAAAPGGPPRDGGKGADPSAAGAD